MPELTLIKIQPVQLHIYARKSWIGRATYDYKGKYLAEFLFRRDGSLKFPPDSRWGNFPGLLLGWRASEEGFWKNNISFINYFKLRASYGKMGMDPGNPFQYTNSFGLSSGMVFGTGTYNRDSCRTSCNCQPEHHMGNTDNTEPWI